MRDYDFGNLIYELRKKRNLTQSQLGEKLGISDKAVSKWENGVTKPSVDMLYKLADFFEVVEKVRFGSPCQGSCHRR